MDIMTYTNEDHTFVVCAYKESPYLEESIQSVLNQTVKGKIIISTATPNDFIRLIAEKYNLPVFINEGKKSIADDWNFGYSQAKTPLITLCHQDDIYAPDYLKCALEYLNAASHPLLFFTDYHELRNGRDTKTNRLLKIKRMLLFPLRGKRLQGNQFIRRRVLSMGCPICCPSVTFVKENLPDKIFVFGYKSNVDWQAWEKLSRLRGRFVYCSRPLMFHRIHEGSETSQVLGQNARTKEDYEMFSKFWPQSIAKLLTKVYAKSEKSNQV